MNYTLLLGCCSSPHIHSFNLRELKNSNSTRITSLGLSLLQLSSSRRSWNHQFGRSQSFTDLVVVQCCNSSSSSHRLAEQMRRQIFEDGFAVYPGMWSKGDGDAMVIAQEQQKVLESFLAESIDPERREFVNVPAGHRCTDGAISPEPYWHHSWQIAGMEGEELQRPSWSATLIVSLSDRTANKFCGGIAVFPRSHWIMNDSIANSTSFPHPCDVPAAAPMELRLERGDMALLHPLLAYTIAPNVSSSSTQLLVFKLAKSRSAEATRCGAGGDQWRWIRLRVLMRR